MVAYIPASISKLSTIIKGDGPYGYYVDKAYSIYEYVMNFILKELDWLKETGGQRTFFIKIPEAIVHISKRIGPTTSIPGKMLSKVADVLMPLHILGGCAKTFLAFVDVTIKFPGLFKKPQKDIIEYVVINKNNEPQKAQTPFNYWEQQANKAQVFADWALNLSECGSYVWKWRNPTSTKRPPFANLATWSGRYMCLKGLYFESKFLYQIWWEGKHLHYNEEEQQYVPINGTVLAKEDLIGSMLKISLSVVCLSLDVLQTFAPKENRPFWLESAIFWTRIAPTFITPVAIRYWPNLVTKPLYAKAVD
jgi:hypothetical protein